jgi:UDP-glucose 4-epimerase
MNNKKILITGSSGFIGTHLVRRLLTKCEDTPVHLPTRHTIIEDIKRIQPNVIVHLAGNPSTKPVTDNEVLRTNIELTHNILLSSPKDCHFIFASTILVYGERPERFLENSPCSPTSVYGATKLASEALVNAYTNQGRIRGLNLRMSATVGSGMNHGALPDLLRKVREEDVIRPIGKWPGAFKPYTHVSDVVNGILYGIEHSLTGTYNLCTPDNWSIDNILDDIEDITGIQKKKEWNADAIWKGDNLRLEVDNWKIRKAGFKFKYVSSSQAIKQAIRDLI